MDQENNEIKDLNDLNENKQSNSPKKKNIGLIVLVSILCIGLAGTALGFVFKDTIMYNLSPKSYLYTALAKTSLKLASEVDASVKNNKFFDSISNLKYDNFVSTTALSDETSSLLQIPSGIKVLLSNDTVAERFSLELNKDAESLFGFYFSDDKAVVKTRIETLYFDPKTLSEDYNVWIVPNKPILEKYGIGTFPDSLSDTANFSYKAFKGNKENYMYKELLKNLNIHFKKLMETGKVEKQNVDYTFGTEIVPSKEIKLTFAPTDLQEFYNKSLEAAIADKDFYSQLEMQALNTDTTVDELISTYREIKINGDVSIRFNIYKDMVVSTNVNFIGTDSKVAFIINSNDMNNIINNFSLEIAADESKLKLDVVGDFLNKDLITSTIAINANGMVLGKLTTEWDQNKTTDNLLFKVSEIPPMFGAPMDISLSTSAYTENDTVVFNVGKLNVATESIDLGFSTKIEKLKNEIVIPETDKKIFDMTAEELFSIIG